MQNYILQIVFIFWQQNTHHLLGRKVPVVQLGMKEFPIEKHLKSICKFKQEVLLQQNKLLLCCRRQVGIYIAHEATWKRFCSYNNSDVLRWRITSLGPWGQLRLVKVEGDAIWACSRNSPGGGRFCPPSWLTNHLAPAPQPGHNLSEIPPPMHRTTPCNFNMSWEMPVPPPPIPRTDMFVLHPSPIGQTSPTRRTKKVLPPTHTPKDNSGTALGCSVGSCKARTILVTVN